MTEKLNTSNISTLATSIVEETGIRNIANGVTNKPIAKTLVQQWGTDPNGYTKKIHCKEDCTYTLVYAPGQDSKGKVGKYYFQICLGENVTLPYHSIKYTTLLFSGKFLAHR